MRIMDCTDEELAQAIHFLDAHDTDMLPSELSAWRNIKDMILARVESDRELAAEIASEQADVNG